MSPFMFEREFTPARAILHRGYLASYGVRGLFRQQGISLLFFLLWSCRPRQTLRLAVPARMCLMRRRGLRILYPSRSAPTRGEFFLFQVNASLVPSIKAKP
ncbi:hypothetical protein K443DRAFT_488988 [Laccaria amethystina LaAM-08-1]|uniref:Uncharacterized protein n=1 Tax=Laccaria amethystina LaAM-08-1 TaxID=1095629 RepID=A0A0C9XNV7_9AGAR|nr:hypothetical protein K443DRAFT_488988 [Laccaria amethystina LaAM-08-1]